MSSRAVDEKALLGARGIVDHRPRTANREPRTANREPRAAYRKGHAAIKCQPPDADDAPNMPNAKRQTPNGTRHRTPPQRAGIASAAALVARRQ
ncbi:hypothetical protein C7270_10455 [Burkholderia thailandensis]|nr:hypothetical protein [Burkholderia thailandensis]